MFQAARLPRITFMGPGTEQTIELSECCPQIQRITETIVSRTSAGSTIGLIFQTSPELVLAWLGVVAAGRVPLILQYPTQKISKEYWHSSVRDTMTRCQIGTLLCASCLSHFAPEQLAPTIFLEPLTQEDSGTFDLKFPMDGHILQLSSGTTGFKKPIRFDFNSLQKHAFLYNQVMGLTNRDRIVSWLPLYHDMGFIACFVMPLLLGTPVIMIDPMNWVAQPRLLFDAIERFGGSVCYMPNFGFEVMSKLGKSGPFPTMRHWISCSEPTYAATLERFIAATNVAPATISTCYGMAENVFAVTQSSGFRVIERDGQRHVSCGSAIPQTEVKEVSGELFVRSPHSLNGYEGGGEICDQEGFFATGDIGFIQDSEIVVTGRMQDLANIGGRKFLLNDLDFALGQLFPKSAGRIASLAIFDGASGTEKALFLIEVENFWEWERSPDIPRLVREVIGVEWMEVHFVPPRFITKTSSGKINRKRTLHDWLACRADFRILLTQNEAADVASELARHLPGVSPERPALDQLDSLGQLILRLFCEERHISLTAELTLQMIARRSENKPPRPQTEIFSIVALVDGSRIGFGSEKPVIDEDFLQAIAKAAGCPVRFEHICVPPAQLLLSDLIFHDYFLPRNPESAYGPFSSIVSKIKNASLILVDDEDNFRTPPFCVYPVLDHQFTTHADTDLLGHRMQRYTQNHHMLPRRLVLGREVTQARVNPSLKDLESYLGVPIFKMAFHAEFSAHTNHWDFCAHREFTSDIDKVKNVDWIDRFQNALVEFIDRRRGECPTRTGEAQNEVLLLDPPHFCSFLLNRMAVDFVTRIYNSFCIVGRPSSLPYLQKRLDQLGKSYFFSSETVPVRDDYECLLLTGGVGGKMPETSKPTFDFVHARRDGEGGGRPHNVPPEIAHTCPPLAACDELVFRSVVGKHGVLIGNLLLNHTVKQAVPDSTHPVAPDAVA
jgi:acyl-CoA synthetase (AMP-forming)/AMP-acid ligase II